MTAKTKPKVKVVVSIVRGKGTPAMRASWIRFWHRIFEQGGDPRNKAGDSSS